MKSQVFAVYWLLLVIFEAIKVSRLHRLEDLHPAKGSKYPSSDQFLDNAVLVGSLLLFVNLVAEIPALLRLIHGSWVCSLSSSASKALLSCCLDATMK
jgi:hypothetical protein